MIMRRSNQLGEGRVGFLVTLVLFAMGVFALAKYIPVRINAYQFREALREEARYASAHPNDKVVAERLMDQATALKIPLDPKKLSIRRTHTQVIISAEYEQPIDFKLTTYNYRFKAEQAAPIF